MGEFLSTALQNIRPASCFRSDTRGHCRRCLCEKKENALFCLFLCFFSPLCRSLTTGRPATLPALLLIFIFFLFSITFSSFCFLSSSALYEFERGVSLPSPVLTEDAQRIVIVRLLVGCRTGEVTRSRLCVLSVVVKAQTFHMMSVLKVWGTSCCLVCLSHFNLLTNTGQKKQDNVSRCCSPAVL